MDEHHNCPTHRRPCQQRSEENYFFRLSKYHNDIMVSLSRLTFPCALPPSPNGIESQGWVWSLGI